jgi:hypothetical protein
LWLSSFLSLGVTLFFLAGVGLFGLFGVRLILRVERKEEIPYKEGILKGIGSSEGMQPYIREVGVYGVGDSTRQELPSEVRA